MKDLELFLIATLFATAIVAGQEDLHSLHIKMHQKLVMLLTRHIPWMVVISEYQ